MPKNSKAKPAPPDVAARPAARGTDGVPAEITAGRDTDAALLKAPQADDLAAGMAHNANNPPDSNGESEAVGERIDARPDGATTREDRIREAAYLLAERRGFQPGSETENWLEAERQVDGAR